MQTKELVQLAVSMLSRAENGRRVVLYVDQSMVDGPTGCFLPVMNVEGDNRVWMPFPAGLQEQIAEFFGPRFKTAGRLVDELNAENGIDKDDARNIVLATMFPGSRPDLKGLNASSG